MGKAREGSARRCCRRDRPLYPLQQMVESWCEREMRACAVLLLFVKLRVWMLFRRSSEQMPRLVGIRVEQSLWDYKM